MFPPLHFTDCHDVDPSLLFLIPTITKSYSGTGERGTTANEMSYAIQALLCRYVLRRACARYHDNCCDNLALYGFRLQQKR